MGGLVGPMSGLNGSETGSHGCGSRQEGKGEVLMLWCHWQNKDRLQLSWRTEPQLHEGECDDITVETVGDSLEKEPSRTNREVILPCYHHGRCCPHHRHTGGAGINAAPPLAITTGGPGIIAVVPPPSNQGRLALSNILEYAKMPAFHRRQILSAHNTTRHGAESVNQELEKLLMAGEDGHRLSLKMPNSYRCDDGLAVHTYTDDRTCSKSDAKASEGVQMFANG